ncbi:Citrate synthase-like, core [Pseudocohnilembus persalinus]|uniref:Citrate synthase n=1 Tax=Pseudocohnilembus persalinus TaxID=266149 RepID=A0A0V0R1K0_PSEPJ|nr:Citrate synthase-like, core [Pseudocohnilembus persalinus]|eukprot:KRX08363.1 Citrate synthase-like, core [Pseudocohnilembus persalinus]
MEQNYTYKTFTEAEQLQKIKPIIPQVPKEHKEATLTLPNGTKVKLPVYQGTEGDPMIDIQKLYAQTGLFTFDPGFTATGSCASTITYINGGKGELRYRGYEIEDLAKNSTYMEVCYLLIYGELPDVKELEKFESLVVSEMLIHQKLVQMYDGFQKDAHPMAIISAVVGAMSSFMNDIDIKDPRNRENIIIKTVAKLPTIAAFAYRTANGLPILQPQKKLSYMENFLYMLFGNPMEQNFSISKEIVKAMETIFIVHADHEQNASTSTVRIAGSSNANPIACISAGIASLWGPAHGGANEACLKMLHEIGDSSQVPEVIKKIKEKKFRLMGFGHRIYKNFDPRAQVMKDMCDKVLKIVDKQDCEILKIALELEKEALSDQYFVDRKLYPNVDYYTGIIYEALDIPRNMFTVMFAIARSIGWIVHWNESISENLNKISRPRQLYVGHDLRDFIPIEEREEKQTNITELPRINKITNLQYL